MTDWFSLKCPYCGHRVGLHAGVESVAEEPGTCSQASPQADGTWTPCTCLGWWSDGARTVLDYTSPQLPLEVPA